MEKRHLSQQQIYCHKTEDSFIPTKLLEQLSSQGFGQRRLKYSKKINWFQPYLKGEPLNRVDIEKKHYAN